MKELIKEHFKYVIVGFSAILFAIIIGISLYYVESNKSESIERQKSLEFQQEQQKLDLDKKHYRAKRSKECSDIYYQESERYRNVLGGNYDSNTDKCIVEYEDESKKNCVAHTRTKDDRYCSEHLWLCDLGCCDISCDNTFTKEF